MQRPSRFGCSGLPVTPWAGRPSPVGKVAQERAGRSARDPMGELLHSLRGREVTLQVGGRLLTGRLVTAHPVILVDAEGRSTLVRTEAILAVTF